VAASRTEDAIALEVAATHCAGTTNSDGQRNGFVYR